MRLFLPHSWFNEICPRINTDCADNLSLLWSLSVQFDKLESIYFSREEKMRWVHLSDLHLNSSQDGWGSDSLRESFFDYLDRKKIKTDHLFVTGDYRHAKYRTGTADENAKDAADYIVRVAEALGIIDRAHIHIVPGNHDLDRGDVRKIDSILQKYDIVKGRFADDLHLKQLKQRFSFFYRVERHLHPKASAQRGKSQSLHTFSCFNEFNLLCLNTALTCGGRNDRGNLVVGTDAVKEILKTMDKGKALIVLAHHRLGDLHPGEQAALDTFFRGFPTVTYLCGDAHQGYSQYINHRHEITVGSMTHEENVTAIFIRGDFEQGRMTSFAAHRWEPNGWNDHPQFTQRLMEQVASQPARIISPPPTRSTAFFKGRTELIQTIQTRLNSDSPFVVLSGMGGIGKTELCRKLFDLAVQKGFADVEEVGWFVFSNDMVSTMHLKWEGLGSANGLKPEEYFEHVVRHTRERGKRLLLFLDNVNQLTTDDYPRLARLGCKIILTTRLDKWERETPIPVCALTIKECLELYKAHLGLESTTTADDEILRQIIALAKEHTLTVELLAKTQKALGQSPAAFLRLLQERSFNLADIEETVSYDAHSERMIEHLAKVFDIANVVDEERRVLRLYSLFPSDPLPVEQAKQWLGLNNLNTINGLVDKGWLSRQDMPDGGSAFSIHPVIARVVQHVAKPTFDESRELIDALADALCVGIAEIFTTKLQFLPFAESVASAFDDIDPLRARLLAQLVFLYYNFANYPLALEYNHKALSIHEKVLGKEHPDTATIYNNLALVYQAQGDYPLALEYYLKALSIREKVQGLDHPDTATTYNNLAGVYQAQGDYPLALEYYHKDLSICERVLGKEHPNTAITCCNLANCHLEQGQKEQAKPYAEAAYRVFLAKLGEGHDYTRNAKALLDQLAE